MNEKQRRQALASFADAIRAKAGWHNKILDEERRLADKWVKEAGLEQHGLSKDEIDKVIAELKAEATRIRHLDPIIRNDIMIPTDTVNWNDIDRDVADAKERSRRLKHAIRTPRLKEQVGVFTTDDLVPASLHRVLWEELDRLADAPVKDFHPGSDGVVQDIIHPSLYPYVHGVSSFIHKDHPLAGNSDEFCTSTFYEGDGSDRSNEQETSHTSVYAWLPSIFNISADGVVKIESSINPLGPRSEHPVLYNTIERIFALALPMIQKSMFFQYKCESSPSLRRWWERASERNSGPEVWRAKVEKQAKEKEAEMEAQRLQDSLVEKEIAEEVTVEPGNESQGKEDSLTLKGQRLKVIVKAANYKLLPGQEYSGSWHVEGAPHERIRASLIYYYSADEDIEDEGLSFRRVRTSDDEPKEQSTHADRFYVWDKDSDDELHDYPSDVEEGWGPWEMPGHFKMGSVETTNSAESRHSRTGRMISFPNWLQHRVGGLKNTRLAGNTAAIRKILCFFVVNENYPQPDEEGQLRFPGFYQTGLQDVPVVSTADILPQQRFRTFPFVYNALDMAVMRATGKQLPIELALVIVDLANIGFTRAEAEMHRRRLMDDRRVDRDETNKAWTETFSLCEH